MEVSISYKKSLALPDLHISGFVRQIEHLAGNGLEPAAVAMDSGRVVFVDMTRQSPHIRVGALSGFKVFVMQLRDIS
jgi:hypothetical protein